MDWSLKSAKYLTGYRLHLTFQDGTSGVVDLEERIRRAPVFKRLLKVAVFKKFHINPDFGVLCWGDDLDIAPETLYREVVASTSAGLVAEPPARYGGKL
jgi:hypothetical protein